MNKLKNFMKGNEEWLDSAKSGLKEGIYTGLMLFALATGVTTCGYVCKKIIPPSKTEFANVTDATFDRQATITFLAPNYAINRAIFVYDLDGKKDSSGQRTAEEAFEVPYRYSAYGGGGNYRALTLVPVNEWKHYVALGINKPLVSNNITQMTTEQQKAYSTVLNLEK